MFLIRILCPILSLAGWVQSAPLDWKEGPGHRAASLPVGQTEGAGFSRIDPSAAGLQFTNLLSEPLVAQNRIFNNGSGVALGDVNGDGLCDIYLCGLQSPNALYQNLGGWKFKDITAEAGVACAQDYSTGGALADLDGDGDLDLLVNSVGGGTRLFFNDGLGRFSESTASGLLRKFGSTSLALADLEGDGDLDLYVTNYRTNTFKDAPPDLKVEFFQRGGEIIAQPEDRFMALPHATKGIQLIERGEVDLLYRNDGRGNFSAVSWLGGAFRDAEGKVLTAPPRDWGLSAMFYDVNGDLAPDLYVCNDFSYSHDSFWINDGTGKFQAAPRLSLRNMSMSSMGVDFADLNRDGHPDFFVVDMLSREHRRRQTQRVNVHPELMMLPFGAVDNRPEVMRNTLFLNRGDGTFAEIAQLSGLHASEWSWCPIFLDVDLDGFEDVLITNGNGHDVLDSDLNAKLEELNRAKTSGRPIQPLPLFPRLSTANLAFRNRGDLTFSEMGTEWGFAHKGVSHGMALGDLDQDGDLDVVVNHLNEPPGLYRNEASAARVAVRLRGVPPNTRGIGAQVELLGGPVPQRQEMIAGGRYLSSDDPIRVFAAGGSASALTLRVTWRSGRQSVVQGVKANHIYEVRESKVHSPEPAVRSSKSEVQSSAHDASATRPPANAATLDAPRSEPRTALFENISRRVGHEHAEQPFDDFARQPLLPKRLSQLGPGVCWHDFNGDGWDDLIVGAGRGGRLGVFQNDGQGGWVPLTEAPVDRPVFRDLTAILGFGSAVIAGSSNYEDGSAQGGRVRIYDLARKAAGDSILGPVSSTGPLAMSDIDADGDLDLFVGGRVLPDRYPEAASSTVFVNEGGRFLPYQEMEKVGLVSGAVFSDLTNDGQPELILACEWGPIRVFQLSNGKFEEQTARLALENYAGWWNGVATGDFDGDGRLDIAASNWGRNSPYESFRSNSLSLFHGDFAGAGGVDLLEAYVDPASGRLVPWAGFDVLGKALPPVRERFETFGAFAAASVTEVLRERRALAAELRAHWLEATLFLNRGERFEARPLPIEAQFAPSFGLVVADFNGDGREDLFLSQNFFDVPPEISRYDAGRGLLLEGDGKGGLRPVAASESGIRIYGQQRACAASDFDADGRIDLAVTQNMGPTQLFRNLGAHPGLRVRLKGAGGNASAIGAAVRLQFEGRMGPVREIQSGSGYWSQNSSTLVLAAPERPQALWIRWPGGKTQSVPIASDAREIRVRAED